MADRVSENTRRTALLLGALAVAVVVPVWLVLAVVGLPLVGLLIAIALGAAAAGWTYQAGEGMAIARTAAQPADEATFARFHNVVEGLAVAAGVPKPRLYVIDDDAPNAFAAGRSAREASLAVTTGLLDKLSRIELEGVIAHELAHIRHLDILPATVAVPLATIAPGLAVRAVGTDREATADMAGVSLTRYPPGLISALEKLRDDGATVRSSSRATDHLWIESPSVGRQDSPPTLSATHPPLDERIEALREL